MDLILIPVLAVAEVVQPAADPLMTELVEALRVAYANGGWLGVLAVVCLFAIRIFRLPFIQSRFPAKGRWSAWPEWVKWAAPFALAFAGGLLLKYLAGMGWAAAAIGALVSAGASIGGHFGTKKLGKMEWANEDQAMLAKTAVENGLFTIESIETKPL
ncbi:hypothetical protein LCGC14_2603860, partial [marine sediment metagenome]